jgi:hypothetical protein
VCVKGSPQVEPLSDPFTSSPPALPIPSPVQIIFAAFERRLPITIKLRRLCCFLLLLFAVFGPQAQQFISVNSPFVLRLCTKIHQNRAVLALSMAGDRFKSWWLRLSWKMAAEARSCVF